jgi:hypothetical protein
MKTHFRDIELLFVMFLLCDRGFYGQIRGLPHRGPKIKKPQRVLLQQDIKPSWFLFQLKSHENSETFWPQPFVA